MISQNIQAARKALGLTQEDLANRLSVARQTVAKWESGESLPDLENAYALAKLLGVSVDDLIAHNEAATGYPILPAGSTSSASCAWENADRSSSRRKRATSSICTQDPSCSFWATKLKASHCRRSKMRNPCLKAMGE